MSVSSGRWSYGGPLTEFSFFPEGSIM